jgi:predicted alpha-1,2-mannosidase
MKKRIFLSIFLLCAQLFAQQNFTQYVNPFIGTGGHGHTYPGATVPFGMVQLSPDNGKSGWDWCSGYNISSDPIVGFSHTHLSGTGIGDLCDILFMPASLPKDADENTIIHKKYLSKFSHNNETASPGYYSVILDDYDIKSELTAALRSGFQKHTFNKISKQLISLDLGYTVNWDAPIQTFIQIIDPQTIAGFRLSKGWANDQRVYFYTKFSKPIINSYLLQDSVYKNNAVQVNGKSVRGIFEFDVPQGESLLIKTGISTVDIDGAKLNLANDIKDWNFDKTRKEALQKWNKELSKIQFKSNDKNIMTTFYTAFYHSMLAPVIYSDVNGNYKGADGKIHKAEGFNRYGIFSLWDTFRAENPLFTIVQSERVADMVKSMLASGNEHGYLPVWELLGNETYCMI